MVNGFYLDEPWEEASVINEREPLRQVPIHILETSSVGTRVTAEENHYGFGLGGNESQKKHILATAIVAFENGVS